MNSNFPNHKAPELLLDVGGMLATRAQLVQGPVWRLQVVALPCAGG